MPVEDRTACTLVTRWHAATVAIIRYVDAKGAGIFDLFDASTLASLFVMASAAA